MADTSVAGDSVKNGSNNVEKSDNFEVPSLYPGLSGLTNKGDTETMVNISFRMKQMKKWRNQVPHF